MTTTLYTPTRGKATPSLATESSVDRVWDWNLQEIVAQMAVEFPEVAMELDRIESEYRHFIFLCVQDQGYIKPPKIVDEFWHIHILNTRDYSNFCQTVAGYYIHHDRFITVFSKEKTQSKYNRLEELSEKYFGSNVFTFENLEESESKYMVSSGKNVKSVESGAPIKDTQMIESGSPIKETKIVDSGAKVTDSIIESGAITKDSLIVDSGRNKVVESGRK